MEAQLNQLCQQAIQKMNASDFEGALNIANKLRSLGPHYVISHIASGLLIDIGTALEREDIVKEGVELLRKDFKAIISDEKIASSAYYNYANGVSALFRFKMVKDPYIGCFRETELDQAKAYYRKALSFAPKNSFSASEIWVNLGNCLDHLGRIFDALECYEEALRLKPNHGMALGNKGMALSRYAVLAGEHQRTFLLEAYSLLSRALKLGVPPEAVAGFSSLLNRIGEHFPDKSVLDNPPEFPGLTIKTASKFEEFLIEYCLRNRLYLNMCDFCRKCDAAIGDTAVIKTMIVPKSKRDRYLRLSAYLNQIKQDYVTARFLLVLSRFEGLDLNFVDKRVKIIDTLDHSKHNIYIQLAKASFKNFCDILDKIACFINEYLELGIPERKIDFRRVWYSDWKTKQIFKKIEDTKNLSLNALFDIHRDFENGPYEELRKTRHALTHRFVNIRAFQKIEDEANMTEDTLVKRTIELSRIVRSAIIYLLHFVYVEEKKKERRSEGTTIHLLAKELPNHLKTNRQGSLKNIT